MLSAVRLLRQLLYVFNKFSNVINPHESYSQFYSAEQCTASASATVSAVPDIFQCSRSSHYKLVECSAFLYLLLALQREARVHVLALGQVQTEHKTFIHNPHKGKVLVLYMLYWLFLALFEFLDFCCFQII